MFKLIPPFLFLFAFFDERLAHAQRGVGADRARHRSGGWIPQRRLSASGLQAVVLLEPVDGLGLRRARQRRW